MDVLIKGGRLVRPEGSIEADIFLSEGKIAAVAEGLAMAAQQVVDARGCLVFPGFIDGHTHFALDNGMVISPDDFSMGTGAAILGGTTSILDFATQSRGKTLEEALEQWQAKAHQRSSCDYGFHMALTDWNETTARELALMVEEGITSFKVYMAYDALRLCDGDIYEILDKVTELGGLVSAHCENGEVIARLVRRLKEQGLTGTAAHALSRPPLVEAEAVGRFLKLAALAGARAHVVHLTSALALEEIRVARQRGQVVLVETCPQYLLLEAGLYDLPEFEGAKYVLSPPLRQGFDRAALWQGLRQEEIQTISTDHCSFTLNQKALGRHDFTKIPNGIPGVEHRPALIYTYGVLGGLLTQEEMASLLSENVARIFGMYPQKGCLKVGSDGDVVVWDPHVRRTIQAATQAHHVDNTPYEGMETIGAARHVFLRGQQVVRDSQLIQPLKGRYIHRYPEEGGPAHD